MLALFLFFYYKIMPKGRQLMRFFPAYNYLQHTWNHVVIYSTPQVKLFTVLLSTLPSVQILDMSGTWPRTNRSRVQHWAATVVWRETEVTTWPNIRKVCLGFTLGGHCLIICCGQKTCELWSWLRYSTLFTFFCPLWHTYLLPEFANYQKLLTCEPSCYFYWEGFENDPSFRFFSLLNVSSKHWYRLFHKIKSEEKIRVAESGDKHWLSLVTWYSRDEQWGRL